MSRLDRIARQREQSLAAVDAVIAAQNAESEWPPLVPLDAPALPRLDLDTLPGWAGRFAHALAISTETPRELAASMVLAICSAAASRRLWVRVHDDYHEPVNTWFACALPSGNRKSAVHTAAASPVIAWERDEAIRLESEIRDAESERKTVEARVKELRTKAAKAADGKSASDLSREVADLESRTPEIPRAPQLWTSDATPERLGTLLADNDECLAWLSSEAGIFDMLQGRYSNGLPNLDLVLKAHSGDAERVDRGSRPPVFLQHPRLTIGLSPQPEALRGLASKPGFRGRGLLARFLYFLPPSPLGFRCLESPPVPNAVREDFGAAVRAMLEWSPRLDEQGRGALHTVTLSDEAYTEWRAFSLAIEAKMRPGGELESFTDWAGKAPGAAVRIAGVLHAIEHAHGEPWTHPITVETMCGALEIMAVCVKHSMAALDLMGADSIIADARHIWSWVERNRHTTFTVRQAFEALKGKFPRVSLLREALSVLEERGYIEITDPATDGPGRRPSSVVTVRPDIVEGWL